MNLSEMCYPLRVWIEERQSGIEPVPDEVTHIAGKPARLIDARVRGGMSVDEALALPAKLTRDELLAELHELADLHDAETAHYKADAALLAYIDDPAISAAFDAIQRWYS